MTPPHSALLITAMANRGAFIVVEGLDRSGKTTQCARLHARLLAAGVAVELLRFPGTCKRARAGPRR